MVLSDGADNCFKVVDLVLVLFGRKVQSRCFLEFGFKVYGLRAQYSWNHKAIILRNLRLRRALKNCPNPVNEVRAKRPQAQGLRDSGL